MSCRLVRLAPLLALALITGPIRTAHAETLSSPNTTIGPRLELRGFFDVTLSGAQERRAGVDSSSLGAALGPLDLFMVSRLNDRTSFLGELVLETTGSGEVRTDLERAYLKFILNSRLQLAVGRTHSPISLWNVLYHHGALLQPTVDRPSPLRFEDDGGLLPMHAVGVEAGGKWPLGPVDWQYIFTVSNGRGPDPTQVQTMGDANRQKAFGFAVHAAPAFDRALTLGVAVQQDRFPQATAAEDACQRILSLQAAYRGTRIDAIAEAFWLEDRLAASPPYHQRAAYAVVSFGSADWHPYLAADQMTVDRADPTLDVAVLPVHRWITGIRRDLTSAQALKLEWREVSESGRRRHECDLQLAFNF